VPPGAEEIRLLSAGLLGRLRGPQQPRLLWRQAFLAIDEGLLLALLFHFLCLKIEMSTGVIPSSTPNLGRDPSVMTPDWRLPRPAKREHHGNRIIFRAIAFPFITRR